MKAPLALAMCALWSTAVCSPASGDTDTLTQVRIESADARRLAQRLTSAGYDVLEGSISDSSFEAVASAESLNELRKMGLKLGIVAKGRPYADIQAEAQAAAQAADGVIPPGYLDLAMILAQMNNRAGAFPTICKVVDLTVAYGTPATVQGRHMFAVKISDNVNADEDEPASLIASCHHSREIITPVIGLDTIDRLLNGYGVDPAITALVNNNEIWVAPVWNPDGYNHVFLVDNLWRKNRRANPGGSFGVDLNRNYPFGWTASCAGSTSPSSDTYKGPSAGSEAETVTMNAWSADRNFAKVLDYHSSGRETLYGYLCMPYPLTSFLQQEASAISAASGYGAGAVRLPSAEGEHQETQVAHRGALGFLTETGTTFQPSYASAQAEAALVWGGTRYLLNRAIPVSGHVTSAATGLPVVATITYIGVNFSNGEANKSQARFGRYHAFLPIGSFTINYAAPGYVTAQRVVVVGAAGQVVDVALEPVVPPCYANCDGSTTPPVLNVNDFTCFLNRYGAGDTYANCDGSTVPPILNVNDFTCFLNTYSAGCT